MKQKNDQKCHTHTYLTKAEENNLAKLILKEIPDSHDRKDKANLLPAPSELCDLIF